MSVDHLGGQQETDRQQLRIKALETASPLRNSPGGDSTHAGSGGSASLQIGELADASANLSVALGYGTDATAQGALAVGASAQAWGIDSTAVGRGALASHDSSMALGRGADAIHNYSTAIGYNATTTAADQIRLGTSANDVSVPGDLTVAGTFSNPSARRLKRNIIPAPDLRDVFPELVEYEYIAGDGRRRIGYIADDLIGTDAERFVTFDDEGNVAGIDPLGLMMAQLAVMHARITELENKLGD